MALSRPIVLQCSLKLRTLWGNIMAGADFDWLNVLVSGEKQTYYAVDLGVRQNF